MMRARALALSLVVAAACAVPAAAANDRHSAAGGAAPQRPAAPPSRPMQPVQRGFDFRSDTTPQRPAPQPGQRYGPQQSTAHNGSQPGQRYVAPQPAQRYVAPQPGQRYVAPQPAQRYAPQRAMPTRPPFRGTGRIVNNPHRWGGWQWNHGVTWVPSDPYWGGGFWGPWALAGLAGAAFFGDLTYGGADYPSYQVESASAGAQLLQNYGLQQTQCGPPDLVVIWGPDNSVICAYPNDLVAPGDYTVDLSTLSLESAAAP